MTLLEGPQCPCTKVHRPKTAVLQTHHILPKSWGGLTTKENTLAICGTCHDSTHTILNVWVRTGGKPRADDLRRFHPFARQLARRAVDAVGGVPPRIFTASQPAQLPDQLDPDPSGKPAV